MDLLSLPEANKPLLRFEAPDFGFLNQPGQLTQVRGSATIWIAKILFNEDLCD